jgi:hypothetical protein
MSMVKAPVPAAVLAPAITDQKETNKKDRAFGLFCFSAHKVPVLVRKREVDYLPRK